MGVAVDQVALNRCLRLRHHRRLLCCRCSRIRSSYSCSTGSPWRQRFKPATAEKPSTTLLRFQKPGEFSDPTTSLSPEGFTCTTLHPEPSHRDVNPRRPLAFSSCQHPEQEPRYYSSRLLSRWGDAGKPPEASWPGNKLINSKWVIGLEPPNHFYRISPIALLLHYNNVATIQPTAFCAYECRSPV